MKTEKQWEEVLVKDWEIPQSEVIRKVQVDALKYALEICGKQFEPRPGEDDDHSCGYANRGVGNCVEAITDAIKLIDSNPITKPSLSHPPESD